ncbi:MAG: hypothetical protein V4487_01915 [Chlamydiota bacterium]
MDRKDIEKMQEEVMKWYGWGSPIGLTIFLIGLAIFAVLLRFAILGIFF